MGWNCVEVLVTLFFLLTFLKIEYMKKKIGFFLRCVRRMFRMPGEAYDAFRLKLMLFINHVEYKDIHSNGLPYFCVGLKGTCRIGRNFSMNNGLRFNPIGFPQPCTLYVGDGATLTIGDNVGMSQASIICHYAVEIQDNVKFGGGVKSMIQTSIR